MNKKILCTGLCAQVLLFAVWTLNVGEQTANAFITFPLAAIGRLLRRLSLSGTAGNIAAWLLFLAIACSPVLFFFWLKKTGTFRKIDRLWYGMPVVFAFVLYFLVNPGMIPAPIPQMGTVILESTFYAVVAGILCLRVLSMEQDFKKLMKGLLYVLFFLLSFFVLKIWLLDLPVNIQALEAGNLTSGFTGEIVTAGDLGWTKGFFLFRAVLESLPMVVDGILVCMALEFLRVFVVDAYSEAVTKWAERIAFFAKRSLQGIVAMQILFHILQYICLEALHTVDVTVSLPITSLLLVVFAYGAANYISNNQQMKEEQDLYI